MAEIEPDVSVCTVAGHKPQVLRRLLRSIHDTADPVSVEIVVAETGPGAATGLADDFPGLLVVHTPGLSRLAALNQALCHGRGRYAALLDPEVVVLPECLKRLIDFMDDTPDVGLAAPKIVDAHGMDEPSVLSFPGLFAMLLGSSLPGQRIVPARTSEIDWSSGGFHLFRRECLDEIGQLDEALPVCAELDRYRQARRQGWHSMYVAEAIAVHARPDRQPQPLRPGLRERIRLLKKQCLP